VPALLFRLLRKQRERDCERERQRDRETGRERQIKIDSYSKNKNHQTFQKRFCQFRINIKNETFFLQKIVVIKLDVKKLPNNCSKNLIFSKFDLNPSSYLTVSGMNWNYFSKNLSTFSFFSSAWNTGLEWQVEIHCFAK